MATPAEAGAVLEPGDGSPGGGAPAPGSRSLDHLIRQGHGEGLALLAMWREQKSGIRVEIAYEDILGNEMSPLSEELN